MNNKIEKQFPWVSIIKGGFLKSFSDDYDIGTLELLQKNITEEIQRITPKSNLKIAKLLFECIEDFYYHFCRKWYQRKKFSPPMEVAWVHILTNFIKIGLILSQGNKKSKWIHQVLSAVMRFQGKNNLIYDALLSIHSLNKKYQCAYGAVLMHILIYIPTFVPVIIDEPAEYLKVFLLVRRLKFLIRDPVEKAELRMKASKILAPPTLSIWLLSHDFNVTWMNSVCKINLGINICKKLKGKGSEKVVVETLRKILLPGISTERRAEQQASCLDLNETTLSAIKKKNDRSPENTQTYTTNPSKTRNINVTCSNPFLSKDDKEVTVCKTEIKMKKKRKDLQMTCDDQAPSKEKREITVNKIKRGEMQKRKNYFSMIHYNSLLSEDNDDQTLSEVDKEENIASEIKKMQKRKKYTSTFQYDPFPSEYDDEHINMDKSDMKKSIENIKDIVVSEENAFNAINHSLTINVFDNSKLVINKKNRKRKAENLQCKIKQDDLPYHECSSKPAKKIKQENQKLDKVAEKKANEVSQNSIDSYLLKNMKQSSFDEPNKVHLIHQNDEKGKQREEVLIIAEKNPEIISETPNNHSLPKNISQFSETTKNGQKKYKIQKANKLDSNTKEIEFITVNSDYDVEDSPVIIDEINVSEPIPNEKSCISKCRNVNSSFSCSDDNQPVIVTEIKNYSNFGLNSSHEKKNKPIKIELKSNTGTEIMTEFVNPSNYDSAADQIAYDTINDVIQKNESICAKSENMIDKEEYLNSLINLTDLQDDTLFVESNLRLKIADKSHTSEEILNSCASNTRNDQQNPISKLNITDKCFTSKENKNILTDNQTNLNVNHENHKHEEIQYSCSDSSNLMRNDQQNPISESNITDKRIISEGKKSMPTHNQTNINVHGKNYKHKDEIKDQCPDCSSPMKKDQQELFSESNFTNEHLISVKENIFSENQVDVNINDQNCENVDLGKVISSSMEGHSGRINESVEESSQDSAVQTNIIDYSPNQTSEFIENYKSLTSVHNSEKLDDKSKELSIHTELKKEKLDIIISHEAVPRLESDSSYMCNYSSLNDENCIQETEKEKGKSESFVTDEFISDTNKVNFSEINFVNTEITKNNPLSFVIHKKKITQKDGFSESSIEKKVNSQEIEIKDTKLISGSNLSNKVDSKVVYNSDSNSSFEIDNPEVVKDNICINTQSLSENSLINDLSKYQITGLFFDAKSPVLNTDADLPEDSQILDDVMKQKLNGETNNVEIKTPCYAASELMENMLKLVEQASNVNSIRQNILKGDLTSTLNSSSAVSAPANEESAKCLSFLDISVENVNNLCETSSFDCLAPKGSEFLQYREIVRDQEDNRSEDTLSEKKSILKTGASEYFSDASIETESEESNFSPRDCNSPVSFDAFTESSNPKNNYDMYTEKTEFSLENTIDRHQIHKEDDENDIRKLQDTKTNISIKNILLEGSMLNPVVYLGKRCDSKNFIFANSTVSADFHDATTNSSIPSDFGDGDEGINKKKPSILGFKSAQTTSEINKSFNPINEISIKPKVIEDLPSGMHVPFTHKYIKISEVGHDIKVEVQSEQNDLKERCLATYKKIYISERDQESIEHVCEKILSQDQGGTECDKDQQLIIYHKESVELASEIKVSRDKECTECDKELTETKKRREPEPSLNMKLRKRPVPLIQKFADIDESCNVSNQNTTAKYLMTLRSRNPPASSSQDVRRGKSQIVTKCSLKKLKTETNLDLDFSELSLNSPKTPRTTLNDSSNKSNSAIVKDSTESPTSGQGNICKVLTCASIISSNDTRIKKQDTDSEGYNLRPRKSVIMPGRLKL
ncbi:uncharacterized protein PF3D7_1120600-like [Argiope bruennichi]|uniref:uncharacterized protein PF3D7_1120600-like n=1 Tax=Argiope bruennichi TaxID=94029 RepID=UPI002494A5B0|nr:uncharacterized protein PF3D7_1120600-like [Argiope bruennichi]